MADSSKSNILLVILLLVLSGLAIFRMPNRNNKTGTQVEGLENKNNKIATSLQKGIKNSSTMNALWKEITLLEHENSIQILLVDSKLNGVVVGVTEFKLTKDNKVIITIKIDVSKVINSGDFVEPILGHELKHINNVLFLYDKRSIVDSVSSFLTNGTHKQAEASAIVAEDVIRKELLNSDSFPNIPITRMDADIRYSTISVY